MEYPIVKVEKPYTKKQGKVSIYRDDVVFPSWKNINTFNTFVSESGLRMMERRATGDLDGTFYLNPGLDWVIALDENGIDLLLLAVKKGASVE